MDEQTISPEARLEQLNEERKTLKKQVKDERTLRLEKAAEMRDKRDQYIEAVQEKLKKISEAIYAYNKLGKVAKKDMDIITMIHNLLDLNHTS